MVEFGLSVEFKHQVLQWGGETIPMKEPISLLRQSNITSCDMREVVIQTAEPVSTREATEILVKILNSTYVKAYLRQVADNVTHMNS